LNSEFWKKILAFNDKYFPNWRNQHPVFLSNALAGEVGETCDLIKHWAGGGTNRYNPADQDIAFEIVDMFVYAVLLLENLGIDEETFNKFFDTKLALLEERMKKK